MNLYLLRHAIAADPSPDGDDSQRPLTLKGRQKLDRVIRFIQQNEIHFDLVLTSPFLRARQTAEALARALNLPSKSLRQSEHLTPLGFADKLVDEINNLPPAESILLVGHEPNLSHSLGTLLAGDANLGIHLKKAGLARLSINKLTYGPCATLDWLIAPGLLDEGEKRKP